MFLSYCYAATDLNCFEKKEFEMTMDSEVVIRLRAVATCVGIEVDDERLEAIVPDVLTLFEQAADSGFHDLGEVEPAFTVRLNKA